MDPELIEKCIERVKEGDIDAFGDVVRETQDRLRSHILWIYPCSADAVDDVAQEVYLFAYQKIGEYEAGTDFWTWLKTLARFRALNHVRLARSRAEREQKYFDAVIMDEAGKSEEVPDPANDLLSAVSHCLELLPATGRSLLMRKYGENLDMAALGRMVGKTPGNVRINLMRLREQLKKCVEKSPVATGGEL